MKKIVFRVDSSNEIGTGHVMRCLTLAGRLKKECDITFICRDLEGNIGQLIKNANFTLIYLSGVQNEKNLKGYENWIKVKQKTDALQTVGKIKEKIDCLIIDNYAIDAEWETILEPCAKKIMVIDDLANRKHSCDMLLDQNYNFSLEKRYNNLVIPDCRLFLGPKYALLREEFLLAHKRPRKKVAKIERILLFFGGIDPNNETLKVLKAIMLFDEKLIVDVVVGVNNPHNMQIKTFCEKFSNINFHCQINNMAELMNKADICIGAGGAATLEKCFMLLPSIVIAVAENQISGSEALDAIGCIDYLGGSETVNSDAIKNSLQYYADMPHKLAEMSTSCERLFNGYEFAELEIKNAILDC